MTDDDKYTAAFVCGECHAPVQEVPIGPGQPFDSNGGVAFICPNHGQLGFRADYGELDLGAIRSEVYPPKLTEFIAKMSSGTIHSISS